MLLRSFVPGCWVALIVLAGVSFGCGPKGQVTIRGPEASDRAPQEWAQAFTEAMDNNRKRFVTCYEEALKGDGSVQGTVTVKIELGAPSIPYSVDNTTGSESLADCVVEWCPSTIYLGSPPEGYLKFELDFAPQ